MRTIWPIERPANGTLAFGKTTQAEIMERYGKPVVDPTFDFDGTTKVCKYPLKKHDASQGPHTGEAWAQNGQLFLFENEILVGEVYYSSWEADDTDFDELKSAEIIKGQTARDQVLAMLGPSSGRKLCPGDDPENPTGLEYLYVSRRRQSAVSGHDFRKWLSVQFDPAGIATDVRLISGFRNHESDTPETATD
ncbi:MAG: hypothetical protein H0T51_06550 [Pirellulales bacterium]|nr:hypothetical protein [Pirellulales bacterium]